MVNTKHGRFRSAFWRSLGVFLLSVPLGTNAVEISNGVPEGTVGSYRVVMDTGGGTRNVIVTAARFASNDIFITDVVNNYYAFVDPGINGLGERLLGSAPVPDPITPNIVTSNGSFFNDANRILWTAVSSIAPGAQVMTTTYRFTAETGVLGPLRFLRHLDEIVQAESDDVFFHTGSAVGGDLELFTFDNTEVYGLSHSGTLLPGTGLQNASFQGWAADRFDNIISAIVGPAGQLVFPDGVITNLLGFQHPQLGPVFGPANIVSVLAWDVDPNATSAVITTSLGGIPISDQTLELRPVGNQLHCRKNCTFRATCLLPPGARCTNQINVTVTKKALGLSGRGRVRFASGAAKVAPGPTGIVRLKLTTSARQFLRSGTKKKLSGVMQIRNVARTSVSAIPMKVRSNSTGPSPIPDVVVTSLSYANGTFTSTVKNQGTAATPSGVAIGVGYSVDGIFRTFGGAGGPLAVGASVTIDNTTGGPFTIPTGTHTITAHVDDANRFAELDETNNRLSQPITVP